MSTNHEALVSHVFYIAIIIIIQEVGYKPRSSVLFLLVLTAVLIFSVVCLCRRAQKNTELCPRNMLSSTDYATVLALITKEVYSPL